MIWKLGLTEDDLQKIRAGGNLEVLIGGSHVQIGYDGGGFACNVCSRSFVSAQSLGVHKVKKHGIIGTGKRGRKSAPESKNGQAFTCKKCGRHFQSIQAVSSHLSKTHGIKGTSPESAQRRAKRAAK